MRTVKSPHITYALRLLGLAAWRLTTYPIARALLAIVLAASWVGKLPATRVEAHSPADAWYGLGLRLGLRCPPSSLGIACARQPHAH
jgi:hypothetical protein